MAQTALKKRPVSAVLRLRERETHCRPRDAVSELRCRPFFGNVTPNICLKDVNKPNVFFRKFSPDGKYLMAFGPSQSDLLVYEYRGTTHLGNFLTGATIEEVRQDIFDRIFRLKFVVHLTRDHHHLHRECSLFSDDDEYILVASSAVVSDEQIPQIPEMFPTGDTLSDRYPVDDYCVYCVRLATGEVCDRIEIKRDRINFAHNQGVYLHGTYLAMMSLHHQVIRVYMLNRATGKLTHYMNIGNYIGDVESEIEMNHTLRTLYHSEVVGPSVPAAADRMLNMIKHRFLTFLFRDAIERYHAGGDSFPIRNFYRHFDLLKSLNLWRMQLLDDRTFLIRWATEDVILRQVEPESENSFFMFYDFQSDEVLAVFENVSERLLYIYEQSSDFFRNVTQTKPLRFPCSLSSAVNSSELHERMKSMIKGSRNVTSQDVARRFLSSLPINAQSFSTSPYLDTELFAYDMKYVSALERPKVAAQHPIKLVQYFHLNFVEKVVVLLLTQSQKW